MNAQDEEFLNYTFGKMTTAERISLLDNLKAAAATGEKLGARVGLEDLELALRGIAGLNQNLRHAVLFAIIKSGIADAGQGADALSASSASSLAKTPAKIAAEQPNALPLLRSLKKQLARVDYDMVEDKPIDVFKLNSCLRANRDPSKAMELKTNLAQLGLIQ